MSNRPTRRTRSRRPQLEALEAREVLSTATLQLIHNSAAAPMGKVDVYANNKRIANDLSYRAATAFLTVPANQALKLDITDWRATGNARPIASQTVRLSRGQSMVGVMAGTPGASGASAGFGISMASGAKTRASRPDSTDVLVFNGMPGSPQVDLKVENGASLANDAGFRQFAAGSRYQSLKSADLDLELLLGNGRTQVAEFDANLRNKRGQAMVLVATGTMQGGPGGVRMLAVDPNGQTTLLPVSATDIQGTDDSDFFVVTSPSEGITQVINTATGAISDFVTATSPVLTIDARGGQNGVVVYNPNRGKVADVNISGGSDQDVLYLIGNDSDDAINATQTGSRVAFRTSFGNLSYNGLDQIQIFGQAGNDTIDLSGVQSLTASVHGGEGDDTIVGGQGDDFLYGDEGNDTLSGAAGDDLIFGGNGNDRLSGDDGDDRLYGDPGLDILIGGLGLNFLIDPDDLDGDGKDDDGENGS